MKRCSIFLSSRSSSPTLPLFASLAPKEEAASAPQLGTTFHLSSIHMITLALFRAGRSEDAIKFFNVQRIKGLVPEEEIAKSVILGLCEMGEVDDAWKIFSEVNMKVGFVSVTSLCNCILGSYLKLERFEKAVTLFEKMQEGSFGGPNISTYLVMVNGFYDQGKFSMAFSIFEEMLNNNVPPNGDLYEVIIRGFCESRRLEEAHRYLNKMIENGQLVSYVRWKLIFDSMFVGSGDCLSLGF